MLNQDTKEEVLQYLLLSRYAYVLDFTQINCAAGINGFKPFDEMTDEEILHEYEASYQIPVTDDELYDRMIAEIEAHKMLSLK